MAEKKQEQRFEIQRIYVKDLSFEAPNAPKVFMEKEWKPEISVDLKVANEKMDKEDVYDVVLTITVTAKAKNETAFLVEAKQAGVFVISGFEEEQTKHMLGAFCPNVLFPYAREVISEAVNRGSFPQLLLAPINFDALYQQQLQEVEKQKAEKEGKGKKH